MQRTKPGDGMPTWGVTLTVLGVMGLNVCLGQGAAAADPAPRAASVVQKKVTTAVLSPKDSWFDLSLQCASDHPFLVLDDAGANNKVNIFRAATYRVDAGGDLRFGESIVPTGSWWDSVYLTGVRVHMQGRDEDGLFGRLGHQGFSYFCADTSGAAHQEWAPYTRTGFTS
ncbi:hypothetical protein LQL77_31270 [Rhodococcus cerastii]|nr:hypothetical protein [Rhodococcus cerastii]